MIKRLIFSALIGLSSVNIYADITINNNTEGFGTAQTGASPCSSIIGDQGILKPNSKLNIPQVVFDMYCPKQCEVNVYMNKSCSGQKVATVAVDYKKGVTDVKNHNIGGYVVSGKGQTVDINRKK